MNHPRLQPYRIVQARPDGVDPLLAIIMARSRAEAIKLYCRQRRTHESIYA